MFINTKKTIKITSDNGTTFEAQAGWIGKIPKWVEEHWYFKALCNDNSVTAIVSSRDKDIQKAAEPLGTDGKIEKQPAKSGKSTKESNGDTPESVGAK